MTLLEQRVKEFNIPDWPGEAQFERIIVFQVPAEADAQEKVGSLYVPETVRDAKKNRSPRGIIVSAGLNALDVMASHGMELGEMIWLASWSPFRIQTELKSGGEMVEFFFMNVGDIIVSEDSRRRLKSGEVKIVVKELNHVIVKNGEEAAMPITPQTFGSTIV